MEIWVKLESGRVEDIAFKTYGCAASIASRSMLTEMVKGKSVQEARCVTADQLTEALGGLPLGKEDCPHMAVPALRKAMRNASR